MSESIWKKEIRIGRSKQPKAPKPAKQPKQPKAKKAAPPPAPAAEPKAARRPRGTVVVPVVPERSEAVLRLERWSARVPGSRTEFPHGVVPAKPEPVVEPAPEPIAAATVEGAVEAEPLVAVPAPVAVPERAPEPKPEKVPLLKRELHLRKPKAAKQPKPQKPPKAPKAEKPPKPAKAPKAPKAPNGPKAPKEPRARRELTLPKLSLPKLSLPKLSLPKLSLESLRSTNIGRPSRGPHKVSDVVGLRIGSSQVSAAHVRNNGSAELVHVGRAALEPGLVVNGEVRQPVALAKSLKAFFADNKLPHKDIRLGIASNRIGVRMIEVPPVADPKRFDNAIRFKAQEVLPIPVVDAILDHVVLDETTNAEGDTVRRVLLVFAHRDLVSRYVDVCRQAGLRLTGIDLDAFALLRALGPGAAPEGERHAIVAVAVGHERTVFAVSDGELCEFTRVLEWGGGEIDASIARALNLTPSQALPLKHVLDLRESEPPEGFGAMEFEAARAAAKNEIGVLTRELASSLRFYQSRPDSLAIKEVLLTGGGSNLGGLAEELSAGLGAPVRLADPFARVVASKKLRLPEDPGSFTIAVGLGIEA